MPTRPRLVRLTASAVLAGALVTGLSACGDGSPVDNVVGSAVDGLRGEAERVLGDAVGDVLGGAAVSTDGTLPASFPSAEVPLAPGAVRGGGAAPEGAGWVAQVRVDAGTTFASAQEQLEAAGYAASGVDADADSGFGTFAGPTHRVVLTFSTEASSGAVLATYVVTPL